MQTWKMIKTLTMSPWKKFISMDGRIKIYMDEGYVMAEFQDMPVVKLKLTSGILKLTWREIQ